MLLGLASLRPDVRARLTLHFEDDQNKPTVSVQAFQNLLFRSEIDVLVAFTAQPSLALAPLAEEKKVPMLSVSLVPKIVEGKRYVFSFFAVPQDLARGLVAESGRRGYRAIARVNSIHDGSLVMAKEFDKANAGRIAVVKDLDVQLPDTDFRSTIAALKSGPRFDAIYVNLFFTQVGNFAKQLRAQGIAVPVFSHINFQDLSQVRTAAGALEKGWYVYPVGADTAFYERYRAEYQDGNEFIAYNGFEIVRLVGAIVDRGASTQEELRTALSNLKEFQLANGVARNLGDQRIAWPICVKEIENSEFKTLSCDSPQRNGGVRNGARNSP
jgi:ABC-type branched-subunit amino acid transport system substrate-binding protein